MTWWKGELIRDMSPARAVSARKEIVEWAKTYEQVTGGRVTTEEAHAVIAQFDDIRSGKRSI